MPDTHTHYFLSILLYFLGKFTLFDVNPSCGSKVLKLNVGVNLCDEFDNGKNDKGVLLWLRWQLVGPDVNITNKGEVWVHLSAYLASFNHLQKNKMVKTSSWGC